jgi:hypothetical protein
LRVAQQCNANNDDDGQCSDHCGSVEALAKRPRLGNFGSRSAVRNKKAYE